MRMAGREKGLRAEDGVGMRERRVTLVAHVHHSRPAFASRFMSNQRLATSDTPCNVSRVLNAARRFLRRLTFHALRQL